MRNCDGGARAKTSLEGIAERTSFLGSEAKIPKGAQKTIFLGHPQPYPSGGDIQVTIPSLS